MRIARPSLVALVLLASHGPAVAQFTGPSVSGRDMTVAAATEASVGTYVTLSGRITAHLREDYYLFADESGEIRIEIPDGLWQGREVGPDETVRLLGEVDRNLIGTRYVWVKSLDLGD